METIHTSLRMLALLVAGLTTLNGATGTPTLGGAPCARAGHPLPPEFISWTTDGRGVPVGLIVFQMCRYISLQPSLPAWMHQTGIPVNLFDAMRLVFRKQELA